jgi:hypothetical protein
VKFAEHSPSVLTTYIQQIYNTRVIIWDEKKNFQLQLTRNIHLEEIAELILNRRYLDIVKHPKRPNQSIFVIVINGYVHAVPFVVDQDANIILKTAFPSRKLHKKYGGKNEEVKTDSL